MATLADRKQPRLYNDRFPSVTEVLNVISKPHLDAWRKKVGSGAADKASDTATALGTRVHAVCNSLSQGLDISHEDEKVRLMAEAYGQFLEENVDEVLDTEKSLVSPVLGVGGTLDAYVRLKDGSHAIVDIKTSKGFNPDMGLQLAAYQFMMQEVGEPVDHRIIVRLNKDKPGKFYIKYYEDHGRDIDAFRAAVVLWCWVHRWYPDDREIVEAI